MMQTWVAVSLIIAQGLIVIVLLRIMRTFGVYAETLLSTHRQNLKIRENLAIQENDYATREILHTHRRKDDPLPELENQA